MQCSICEAPAPFWRQVGGYNFTDCPSCGCIAIEQRGIDQLDNGSFPVQYDAAYWEKEIAETRERAWGCGVARSAEAILYCGRSVSKFLDIGAGGGFLLDALSAYLPASADRFYGVEMFPPPTPTDNPNYTVGTVEGLSDRFDAGLCMEVIEHMTPAMLNKLAASLSKVSNPGAFYFFNTSLAPHVRDADPAYIDPLNRGHVVAWSLKALSDIFTAHGFKVWPIEGKPWAFGAEFQSDNRTPPADRIWSPIAENKAILHDPVMGSMAYILALDTARAYH